MANNNIPDDEQEFMNAPAGPLNHSPLRTRYSIIKMKGLLDDSYLNGYSSGYIAGREYSDDNREKKDAFSNMNIIQFTFMIVGMMDLLLVIISTLYKLLMKYFF